MLCFLFISLLCFNFVPFTRTWLLCPPDNETLIYSCSNQLWSNTKAEDACQVHRYYLNTPDCQAQLPEKPQKNPPQRGTIKIEPFMPVTPDERRTVFKITAHNITWNNLKIRFHQQNTTSCMKREFFINESVPKNKTLTYDCPWATASFEDKLVEFEYTYGVKKIYDGKRTFLIHVPRYENLYNINSPFLHNVTFFNYVETTDLYRLVFKIHTALFANVPSYEIYVDFIKNNGTRTDGPFVREGREAVLSVIDFEYDTFGIPGEYVFRVRPWECPQCRFSVSPVVVIPESSTIITIGIVGVSCLIPILMITLYMYLKVDSGLTPRILLVTTPANDAHKTIGKSLANLLKQKYNIPTMIDIIDIPIANTTPSLWLTESFDRATHVIILISDDKPVTSIYRNIDNLLSSLILRNPNKISCGIKFSFSQNVDLKYNMHRSFKLMQDYNSFINFIHNRGLVHRLIKKVMRNDLYYDLVKQINNYEMNITPALPTYCSDYYSNDETDQNEKNNIKSSEVQIQEEDNLPPGIAELVDECLQEVELNKCNDTTNEDSDTEPLDPLIQSCLEEIYYRDECEA